MAPKQDKSVMDYFLKRYKEAKFRVVPGHWPDFKSKKEVDEWLDNMEKLIQSIKSQRGNA